MSVNPEAVPPDTLRAALRLQIQNSSLRRVAAEVGLSPTGLSTFVGGRPSRSGTLLRLSDWYLQELADDEGTFSVPPDAAAAAALLLLRHLPPELRPRAAAELVRTIDEASRDAGVPAPPWLRTFHSAEGE